MQLSITTDYVRDHGDPEPYLRRIADAGLTHLHWRHHWRSDFLNPMSTKLYLSLAHDEDDLSAVLTTARAVLKDLKEGW